MSISKISTNQKIQDFLQFDPEKQLITKNLEVYNKPSRVNTVIYALTCGCLGASTSDLQSKCNLNKVSLGLKNVVEKRLKEISENEDKESVVKTCTEAFLKFNRLFDRVNSKRKVNERYDTKIRFEKVYYEELFGAIIKKRSCPLQKSQLRITFRVC